MTDESLSVCIITKNEKNHMEKCIKALEASSLLAVPGSEIVVVDTGSTDGTRELLAKLEQESQLLHVFDYAWQDDFAAAKNYAVSQAVNCWVMVIDSDEFLTSCDAMQFGKLLKENPEAVGRIRLVNQLSGGNESLQHQEWISRIFRKDKYHYVGKIHEQVQSLTGAAYRTFQAPVEILHVGYNLPLEQRRQKANRNVTLLQKELAQKLADTGHAQLADLQGEGKCLTGEEQQIPYLIYQIGKSYYFAQDYADAVYYFAEGLSFDLDPKLEYVVDMVQTYGYALINSGQAAMALQLEGVYDVFGNTADFHFLMGLIYMNNARYEEAVAEFQKAASFSSGSMIGVNSYLAFYNIGVIYECLGQLDEARHSYEKCETYEPARRRLASLRVDRQGEADSGGEVS
jgi:hypothetical protein